MKESVRMCCSVRHNGHSSTLDSILSRPFHSPYIRGFMVCLPQPVCYGRRTSVLLKASEYSDMVIGSRSPGVTRSALGSGSRPGAVPEPSGATFLFVLGVWFTPPNGLDSHTAKGRKRRRNFGNRPPFPPLAGRARKKGPTGTPRPASKIVCPLLIPEASGALSKAPTPALIGL